MCVCVCVCVRACMRTHVCVFQLGVNGKTWRLTKFWYLHSSASVCSKGLVSDSFQVHHGVKQGSILSPILFAIVMDDLNEQ